MTVEVVQPLHMIECSECGRGNFALSNEQHPAGGWLYRCTWGGCVSEGVTVGDIVLDEGEVLVYVETEAGWTLAWRHDS